ncbi:YqaJ viral recombinase family nuclease [Pseudomonas oryzihabitans]|uniref:YqaJ viral recombinase family nuclease n=1 Tax=Pseudomonas oryzihabitans TaxID=47885 RepID=UPI00123A6C92|nr:YqaJ viral recombinase family protein [Pseudomonas oryzihabitans]QEU05002.1 alkaline phosphatase [Pseudomonas oryzihabitans]
MSRSSLITTLQHPRPLLHLVTTATASRLAAPKARPVRLFSQDAAAALGLDPGKSQLELWLEKTGRKTASLENDLRDDSTPTFWPSVLEPIIAWRYSRSTGRKVRRYSREVSHVSFDLAWMVARVEREVLDDEEVQLLVCRAVGASEVHLWLEDVPVAMRLQVMHLLAVTGKHAADVAVLLGGQQWQINRIERDEASIAQLIEGERQFWRYVDTDRPPPADGSASAGKALACLYPQDSGARRDFRQQAGLLAIYLELKVLRQALQAKQARAAELQQRLQQALGDATYGDFPHGSIRWQRGQDRTVLDVERLLQDQPELLELYAKYLPGERHFFIS